MSKTPIKVPDVGDFDNIPVIEVLVSEGEQVEKDQSLITLESDKATMEVPSPDAGTITNIKVSVGDEVTEGDVIAELETQAGDSDDQADDHSSSEQQKDQQQSESQDSPPEDNKPDESDTDDESADDGDSEKSSDAGQSNGDDQQVAANASKSDAAAENNAHDYDCDVLVIGAGPGGYAAAFRAADLGLDVVLVERYPDLGGVCLNVGCIPSKALLHTARVLDETRNMAKHGVQFGEPDINLDQLRDWKNSVVKRLTGGLAGLARKRKVRVITGTAKFSDAHQVDIDARDGQQTISFAHAIIAAGSQPVHLPGLPWDDERLMDSTGALELSDIPGKLLVIGGGIIGLEMACVYASLGSAVTIVELMDQLMPGTDKDLVKPLQKLLSERCEAICLETRVDGIEAGSDALKVSFSGKQIPDTSDYDRVLVSVGRVPNGNKVDAGKTGVKVTERGFIETDNQQRTNVSHIFAIGDVIGQPMLAHKATHEGKVAAEVIAGEPSYFDAKVIPSVAYTDPEVAWAGITETQAKQDGLNVETAKFPWAASGRALGMARDEGFTKLIFDADSKRIVGAAMVGPHAGDLIAECCLAIEMGCDAEDIGLTIHPHPTLSETIGMAAEAFSGTLTDLYMPKKK